jgi:hypothetical protein
VINRTRVRSFGALRRPQDDKTVDRAKRLKTRESKILLGAHMSIAGGLHRAIERSRSIDASAMQIFVKNNMQWFARPLERAEITAFLRHAAAPWDGPQGRGYNYFSNRSVNG